MIETPDRTYSATVNLRVVKPFDFSLSLRAIRSFGPPHPAPVESLRLAARIKGAPVTIEIVDAGGGAGDIRVNFHPGRAASQVRDVSEWVIFADLDLAPFYRVAARHPGIGSLTRKLHGLKPSRPASLFEMAVIAITEQQISLASARSIRNRLIEKFGVPVEDLWLFPEPDTLAGASSENLRACGLSKQKADYIQTLARNVAGGTLDIDGLKRMGDEEARNFILNWKGFGPWSADYILVRGLARPDSLPAGDIGVRDVVGKHFLKGQRATAEEVIKKLEPFRPYRGLLAFYLLAEHRLALAESQEKKLAQPPAV